MNDAIDPATYFDEMATRIRKNPGEFAGAYVIVGPDMVTVTNAMFGSKGNVPLFWATAKNHVTVEADSAAQAAEDKNRGANSYGRR